MIISTKLLTPTMITTTGTICQSTKSMKSLIINTKMSTCNSSMTSLISIHCTRSNHCIQHMKKALLYITRWRINIRLMSMRCLIIIMYHTMVQGTLSKSR